LEELVAELTDFLLIFQKSPGSFVGLEYFANSKTTKKIFVVKDEKLQGESFINLGPVDKINKVSAFRPTLIVDYNESRPDFSGTEGRLLKLRSKYRKKLELKPKGSVAVNALLYVIYQVVSIFQYISIESIVTCVDKLFGKGHEEKARYVLSILIAANYVNRVGEDNNLFSVADIDDSFLEFTRPSLGDVKASVILFYQKNHPDIYELIGSEL